MIDDHSFSGRIEEIVREAIPKRVSNEDVDWFWEDLAGPIADFVVQCVIDAGTQDPEAPGKLRVDAGTLDSGYLQPNPDAVIVIDFPVCSEFEEVDFRARYNLADELIGYAAVGEEGWDIARQVDQLEKTIDRLKTEAKKRGWHLPSIPR